MFDVSFLWTVNNWVIKKINSTNLYYLVSVFRPLTSSVIIDNVRAYFCHIVHYSLFVPFLPISLFFLFIWLTSTFLRSFCFIHSVFNMVLCIVSLGVALGSAIHIDNLSVYWHPLWSIEILPPFYVPLSYSLPRDQHTALEVWVQNMRPCGSWPWGVTLRSQAIPVPITFV